MKEEVMNLYRGIKGQLNTYVNGRLLEKEVPGFQTLNAFGRNSVDRNATFKKGANHGGFLVSNKLDMRELKIEYWLKAKDNKELLKRFEQLNKILNTEMLDIKFSDEKLHYFGTVSKFDEVKDTTNWVTGEIVITCPDPHKYSDLKEFIFKERTKFNYNYLYDVVAEYLELTIKNECETVKIDNLTNNKFIQLNGTFKKNDVIKININDGTIYHNKVKNMNILNLRSNFEDFSINFNHELLLTGANTCKIQYRERRV